MKLVISEKPSVAQSITAAIGAKQRGDGYLEGGSYLVSWCLGLPPRRKAVLTVPVTVTATLSSRRKLASRSDNDSLRWMSPCDKILYKEVMVCHPRIAFPLCKNEIQIVQRSAS
ncbi:hypothetical protein LY85_1991 [Clostridium sp. KNHs216]|nr:hypothetical protein [Clostridium sp. KNHs216]TQI67304.1 hypothetical protein LY85_1991 [Clostridium sp. KNHs216]